MNICRILPVILEFLTFTAFASPNDILDHDMIESHQKHLPNKIEFREAMKAGLVRSLFGISFDLPFDTIITRMQANHNNFYDTLNFIKNDGAPLKNLYRGIVPKTSSILFKNFYVWQLKGFFPNFYSNFIHEDTFSYLIGGHVIKTLTAFSMALVDSALTPLERWKVWLMTQETGSKSSIPMSRRELFRGLKPTFQTSFVNWQLYFFCDHELRKYFKSKRNEGKLEFQDILYISGIISVLDATLWTPLNLVKTQHQKANSTNQESTVKHLYKVIKKHGTKGIYRAWHIDLFRTFVMTVIDTYYFDKIDHTL